MQTSCRPSSSTGACCPTWRIRRLCSNAENPATFKLPLNGTLPLRADKLSPFKFYQHLLTNVADVEAGKFLRMLTFLPLEEIAAIEAEAGGPGGAGAAQRRLAEEVTRFVHGKEGLQQALAATQVRTISVNSFAVQSTTPYCCLAPHRGCLDGRMQQQLVQQRHMIRAWAGVPAVGAGRHAGDLAHQAYCTTGIWILQPESPTA